MMSNRGNWATIRPTKRSQSFASVSTQATSDKASMRGITMYCIRSLEGIHSHHTFPCRPSISSFWATLRVSISGSKAYMFFIEFLSCW